METPGRQSGAGPVPDGGAPQFFDAPAAFIWHALNAYGDGSRIVADFVGCDAPDHFAPHNALFYKLMQGEMGEAKAPGTLRRYHIDLAAHSLREEILDSGTHEFPMIDPRATMPKHDVAYLISGQVNCGVNTGVKRVDYVCGKTRALRRARRNTPKGRVPTSSGLKRRYAVTPRCNAVTPSRDVVTPS